jgi:hypothetical protein
MTENSDAPDKMPRADCGEMMWNGWILEYDGSVHAARTVDLAVLPGPHRLLLRLNYAMTPEQERMGMVHMVQVALDEAQVESLAMELLDYRNKRRRPVPRIQ